VDDDSVYDDVDDVVAAMIGDPHAKAFI